MKCPFCGESETKVIDSRESDEQTSRRRECEKCSKRFTTYEKVENINLIVLKKGGKKEAFDVEKIRKGVERAAEKRLEKEKIDSIVEIIEQKLRSMETNEIDSKKIGEEVMNQLKKVDKVSYIRFASVYREFTDVDEFKLEVEKLLKKDKGEGKWQKIIKDYYLKEDLQQQTI